MLWQRQRISSAPFATSWLGKELSSSKARKERPTGTAAEVRLERKVSQGIRVTWVGAGLPCSRQGCCLTRDGRSILADLVPALSIWLTCVVLKPFFPQLLSLHL